MESEVKPDEYFVLGLHGEGVDTVNSFEDVLDDNGQPTGQKRQVAQRNVARVRMLVGGKMVDEDFSLPRVITIEEQIDDMVKARMAEIKANGTDPALSNVIPAQPEQIVIEDKNESEQLNV